MVLGTLTARSGVAEILIQDRLIFVPYIIVSSSQNFAKELLKRLTIPSREDLPTVVFRRSYLGQQTRSAVGE